MNEAEIRAWADRVCLDPRYTDEATDEEAERVTELLSIIDWQRKQLTRAQETITDLKRWRPKQ